jgi:hypothetical protein
MMSAATFFGLKGPKAPFYWARFPRFGGCAIPARAVFFQFWAFFSQKRAKMGHSLERRGPILMRWGGRPRVIPRPRLPLGGPGNQGSSRQAVIWNEFLPSALIVHKLICFKEFLSYEAAGKKLLQNDGMAATPLGSWPL